MFSKEIIKTVLIVIQVIVTIVLYYELQKSHSKSKTAKNLYEHVENIDYETEVTSTVQEQTTQDTTPETTTQSENTRTAQPENNGDCPAGLELEFDWTPKTEPKYKLRSDRFLMHVLSNGPNNQMTDLRGAIRMAIALNRTFVMPLFYEHVTVARHTFILPQNRIKPELIMELVSTVDPTKMGELCPEGAVMFESPTEQLGVGMRKDRVEQMKAYHGINVTGSRYVPTPMKRYPFETLAETTFPFDDRCGIMTHPFKNIEPPVNGERSLDDEISRHVQRPTYMEAIVEQFTDFAFDARPFAAVHWRYDRRDFLSAKRCDKFRDRRDTSVALTYEMACRLLMPIYEKPGSFARHVKSALKKHNLDALYIAAPPSESEFIDSLSASLQQLDIKVVTQRETERFFDQHFFNCLYFKDHKSDVVSLFEQEVCRQSDFFIRSLKSSWSYNIFNEREQSGQPTVSIIDVLSIELD